MRGEGSPAFCSVSMFCGLVASSATICTNWVRAFWYCSNTAGRDTLERTARGPWAPPPPVGAPGPTLQHLPLTHGALATNSAAPGSSAPGLRVRGGGDRGDRSDSDGSQVSLCTRVSRATDRNRNAALSRQRRSRA